MFRVLGRALLSSIFLASSSNAIKNAEHMTGPAEALGLPEPVLAVQAHGVANLVGGLMLALGIKPKLGSWILIANLIPTTLGGHRFWEEDDEAGKIGQQIHFMKNLSLLGGLVSVIAGERARQSAQ